MGSGGFSDVYLYDQELPRRQVAVKVLLAEGLTADSQRAFVDEANLMAKLSAHPYIVSIHHADVADDGRPFFIMEYCSGASLADRYKKQPLSVAEAVRTGIRMAGAVATAHQAGVLHRDIKPANILTNEFGWPALTDFGISSAVVDDSIALTATRAQLADGDTGTTASRSVGMSIPWSPPEMFEDDPAPDVRSDVFSLAATVYTLLAGHTPFEVPGGRNQSLDLMSRIERGAITPLTRDDVPAALVAVLKKGMAVKVSDRYDSAVDFGRALQRVELELKLQPTAIDVPNLVVPAPEAPSAGPDDDATRARGVATVVAQPEPKATPPKAAASAVEDRTVMRGAKPAGTSGDAATDEPAAEKKRNTVGIVIGSIIAVVAVAVGAAVVFAPKETVDPDPPVTTTQPPAVVGEAVPAPVLADSSRDGRSVTVSWTNPDPVEGDSYVWQRTDGAAADTSKVLTEDTTATIKDVEPGTTVCVSVWIRRDAGGKISADPLETCIS